MAKNEFLPFGIAEGANVLSNQEYERLTARFNGFVSGVAKSKELNTVWRQSSVMSSALAQFIVDSDNKNLLDNGDITGIKNRLVAAIKQTISGVGYVTTAAMNLELNKKFDKANISGQKGNDNDKVPSLNLFTTEIGKLAALGYSYSKIESDGRYQPKGNYAPAGNYADGNLFRVGSGGAESWVYTPDKSKVFNVNNSGLSGVYDWSTNRYLWGFDSNGMMSSGLIPVAFGGTGARNATEARKNLNAVGVGDFGVGLTPTAANGHRTINYDSWELPTGFHTIPSSGAVGTPPNDWSGSGFIILVGIYGTASQTAYVTQTAFFLSDRNSETYRRSFNPLTKKWTGWSKLTSQQDVVDITMGIKQNWKDVLAQRNVNTNYTNSAAKAIMLKITGTVSANGTVKAVLFVDGVSLDGINGGVNTGIPLSISAIIPPGSSYKIEHAGNVRIDSWAEMY